MFIIDCPFVKGRMQHAMGQISNCAPVFPQLCFGTQLTDHFKAV